MVSYTSSDAATSGLASLVTVEPKPERFIHQSTRAEKMVLKVSLSNAVMLTTLKCRR